MRTRQRGLRGIVARLEADAHGTMATARQSVVSIEDLVRGLVEDLRDGVAFKLQIGDTILPVKLWMVPSEEPPE